MRGLRLPVFHERFTSTMTAEALYERVKFSSGQKIPLPSGHGVGTIYDDITQAQMDEALELWKELCA